MSTDGHREAEAVRALRRIADALERIAGRLDGDDPDSGDEYELAARE